MLTGEQKKSLRNIITALKKERERIERKIKKTVNDDAELRETVELLTSIKGVGFIVAVTLVAIVGDIRLFKNKHSFCSYLGVNPRQFRSGSSVCWSRMSKEGAGLARKCLFIASKVGAQHEPIFQQYVRSLIERGKSYKRAIARFMRKLAGIIYAISRTGVPFSQDTYMEIQAKFPLPS